MEEGVLKKVANFFGFGQDIEYEEEESIQQTSKKPLVGLSTKASDVVVCSPMTFDDVQQIADYLKSKQVVLVNLSDVDSDLARRIVDFVSGVIYAIDGHFQKVKEDIFIFTPKNTNIISSKRETKEGSFFLWGNK